MATPRHRSSASPLAWAYAALVLYASLYPFNNWRWPPGQSFETLAALRWSQYHIAFDTASNLLGYLPLGALLLFAARRSYLRWASALSLAVLAPAALSYGTEVLQNFLPDRVPAIEDFLMNSAGALAGALLATVALLTGLVDRWHALRERWFANESAGALALLALWPVALLFPAPLPLGLGQISRRLREWLAEASAEVPWAVDVHALLAAQAPAAAPLRPLIAMLIVALGLLAPCLVAYAVMSPGWRRVAMAAGALALGVAGMTLSTLLNFGPVHALAWVGPGTLTALAVGLAAALALAPLPRRVVTGVALVVLTGLVVGVAQAPDDPYFAQSLKAWEQGRFVRFHGLAQWVGWLWPYLAMVWLLTRLGRGGGVKSESDQ